MVCGIIRAAREGQGRDGMIVGSTCALIVYLNGEFDSHTWKCTGYNFMSCIAFIMFNILNVGKVGLPSLYVRDV